MELYIIQAVLGALMFGFGGVFFKWNAVNKADDNYFFVALYATGALCFFIDSIDIINQISGMSFFIMAAIVGLGSAGGNFTFAQGMRFGPAGLTSAFAKANIVIVILLSALYYGENITIREGIGILFFFAAMMTVNLKFGGNEKAANSKWFLIMTVCIILLAFRNGGLKVVNEMDLPGELVVAMAYTYCAFLFIGLIFKNRNRTLALGTSNGKTMAIGTATGLVSYGGLLFYISALKGGPASIVVTIFSLDMFFILLLSFLFFGERLNNNQKVGFLLSAIGLVLIGLK
ncbi:EamA family transporter [Pseudemcibacter aquimaris]|uniref:EamA family transporter n=1 Tax=Pseudemcibacter aquimaris TaxID=2857064 RepID=UPI002010F74A|nr:EamA family transporter [Pseudemcibacter aquimaris]MCC3861692.1 DMT family transporter [Pseudemcibacter aquimaris]WDU58463.1 DMT family transporter [Pseudemcibacter aquimaris]